MAAQNLEDEMSRFEQEIAGGRSLGPPLGGSSAPSFVIGASTFSSVQQQLSSLRAQVYGTPTEQPVSLSSGSNVPTQNGIGGLGVSSFAPMMQPPAPPMMTGSNFIPPQLRNSGAPIQMQNRPSMAPPVMPNGHYDNGQPSQMVMTNPTLSNAPVSYEQPEPQPKPTQDPPKVVYSAKPVLNKFVKSDRAANPSTSSGLKNGAVEAVVNERKREAPQTEPAPLVDTQTIGRPSIPAVVLADSHPAAKKAKKQKKFIRTAANDVWEDQSLAEWDPNDFRVFCGDLGNEVTDEKLAEAFKKYPSLQKAKVIRDRRTHKTKGYGFISFKDPVDYTRAMREMNGKYVGNRPIKLRKSNWKDRNVEVVKKKDKEKKRLGFR